MMTARGEIGDILEHKGPYNPGGHKWLLIGVDVWAIGLVSIATESSKKRIRAPTSMKPMYVTIAVREPQAGDSRDLRRAFSFQVEGLELW